MKRGRWGSAIWPRGARAAASAVVAAAATAACSNSVDVAGRFPAGNPSAAQLRTITVAPFKGRGGEDFSRVLTAQLQNASIDGQRYFTVVSQAQMLTRSGVGRFRGTAEDLSALVDFGRVAGVQGVYSGEVLRSNFASERTSSENACYAWRATVDVVPRLISASTGALVYTEEVTGVATHRYCDGTTLTRDELRARARANAAMQIRRAVAPYNATFAVSMKTEAPQALPKSERERFEGAVDFARTGRMDRACAVWQEQSLTYPNARTVALVYNLGVCAEVAGDIDHALALYSSVDASLVRPDAQVNAALERTRRMQRETRLIN